MNRRNRRTLIGGIGSGMAIAGTTGYWFSDREGLSRADVEPGKGDGALAPDESRILYLVFYLNI